MTHRVTIRAIGLLAAAALAVAAVACGSTVPDPGDRPGGDVCQSSSDCPSGQTCRLGYCTRRSARIEEVRFQFIPPQSSGYNPQVSRGVSARPDEPLDFVLGPNVHIDGSISYEDADDAPGPSGPLTFKRQHREDSLHDVQTRVDEGSFEAMVLPGTYDLVFAPEGYPTRVWPDRRYTANEEPKLTVPAEKDLATIQGTVVFRPKHRPDEAEPTEVASAHVLGVSTDGRYTTTIDTTSSGEEQSTESKGHFVLRAIPGSGTYDLVINPGPETVLPKVRVPEAFSVDEDGAEEFLSQKKTSLGTYALPSETISTLSLQLVAPPDLSDGDVDWARTRIVARANPEDLGGDAKSRQFRREISLGPEDEGRLELDLLPARYTIWMHPPADAPLASTNFSVDLTAPDELPSTFSDWNMKSPLRGRVVDHGGDPVAGAELEFWPNGLPADQLRDRLKVTATTGEDGSFSVRLEPRNHDVTVRPPSGAGLPRHWATVRKKPLTRGDQIATIRLPEPMLLRGSVRGESGDGADPIGGTSISATVAGEDRRHLLGKATTDEEGRFYMIVPAAE